MSASGLQRLVTRLCRDCRPAPTDGELLHALVNHRSEAAFELLLARHGPLVLAVCRRVLRHVQDAEDAFQATFLVLIRRASAIRKRDALASWLYGVAYRTAHRVLAMNAKRRAKERQAVRPPSNGSESGADLDAALSKLPEKYRALVILCELQGRSRKDAARELRIAEGTVSSRLATARRLLAKRLRQDGWTGPAVASALAAVPGLLTMTTVRAGGLALAGCSVSGVVSAQVIALGEGVARAMFMSKLKALTTTLACLGALVMGGGPLWRMAGLPTATAQEQPDSTDLTAAAADLKKAETEFQAAQARLAAATAAYQQARQRALRPGEKAAPADAAVTIAGQFRYRVPVEIGSAEFKDGGRLEILEVWGTQPRIEVGGLYIVRGKYFLPGRVDGKVYLYRTATDGNGSGPTMDLQAASVPRGEGKFTLLHSMGGTGYLHLVLAGAQYSSPEANVYFGTGENVLRKKSW